MPVNDPAVGAPILHPVRVTPYDTPPLTEAPLPSVNTTDVTPNCDALALPAAPVEGGRGGLRRTLQVLAAKVTRVNAKQG